MDNIFETPMEHPGLEASRETPLVESQRRVQDLPPASGTGVGKIKGEVGRRPQEEFDSNLGPNGKSHEPEPEPEQNMGQRASRKSRRVKSKGPAEEPQKGESDTVDHGTDLSSTD